MVEKDKDKESLAYRLGEILGTVLVGSSIVLVIAGTAWIITKLF